MAFGLYLPMKSVPIINNAVSSIPKYNIYPYL